MKLQKFGILIIMFICCVTFVYALPADVIIEWEEPTSNITIDNNIYTELIVNVTCILNDCGNVTIELDSDIVSNITGEDTFYTNGSLEQTVNLSAGEEANITFWIVSDVEDETSESFTITATRDADAFATDTTSSLIFTATGSSEDIVDSNVRNVMFTLFAVFGILVLIIFVTLVFYLINFNGFDSTGAIILIVWAIGGAIVLFIGYYIIAAIGGQVIQL